MRALNASIFAVSTLLSLGACKGDQMAFESVNPASGRLSGGEELRIRGANFDKLGNLEVRIGGHLATNVGVQGDDTVVLTTPEGREVDAGKPLDIYLTNADGKTIVLRHAFTYATPTTRGTGDGLRNRL